MPTASDADFISITEGNYNEKYKVKAMYSLQPPYDINEYYGNNDDKLDMLKEFIMQAIKLIENRLK